VSGDAPAGYARLRTPGADAVCLADAAPAVVEALAEGGTLYGWAAAQPGRRTFHGRAPAHAAPLPRGAGHVVVRHAWHGGVLRRLTRDLYLPPTRAPRELRASERLRAAGVRTPQLVAYARYPAPLGLRRADVATRLVPGARDLAAVLLADPADADAARLRAGWLEATAALLGALARAGARHPDLNLKNVLLAPHDGAAGGGAAAWALDVDVVEVDAGAPAPGPRVRRAHVANLARLRRSLEKWRALHGLPVTDADLRALGDRALAHLAAPDASA
jgi:3-deoxy-D-manno-octulosonic acid kinase